MTHPAKSRSANARASTSRQVTDPRGGIGRFLWRERPRLDGSIPRGACSRGTQAARLRVKSCGLVRVADVRHQPPTTLRVWRPAAARGLERRPPTPRLPARSRGQRFRRGGGHCEGALGRHAGVAPRARTLRGGVEACLGQELPGDRFERFGDAGRVRVDIARV